MPGLYIAVFILWTIMASVWYYLVNYLYRNRCLMICHGILIVPIMKAIVTLFGLVFWVTCLTWLECSYWLGVTLLNTHLIFETTQYTLFLVIGKGFSVTRSYLEPSEWRGIVAQTSIFYIMNSIILVLQTSVFTNTSYLIAVTILYSFVYMNILKATIETLLKLQKQTLPLTLEMPHNIVKPLIHKYRMYIYFLILVLITIVIEIIAHSILTIDGRIWVVLLVYEISNLLILGTIGYIFRPKEVSPFFFMVPSRLTDVQQR